MTEITTELINIVSNIDGEIVTKKIEASNYEFTISTRVKWEMVIADEETPIEKGEIKKINIKPFQIQQDTITLPCSFMRHAYAFLMKIGTGADACSVDRERTVHHAYIMGADTGKINKGDYLGTLNLLPIMFTRKATLPKEIK
ncbi:MAG: DUF22 domain-containing protein [Methanosarcinales archaeon]|nr:DUF22 domain-containing protein [Methanosarcinales archaeon]